MGKKPSLAKILTEKIPVVLDNESGKPILRDGPQSLEDLPEYDVAIIGGGPAGLFAAHRLAEFSNLKIIIFDKGRDSTARVVGKKPPNVCYIPETRKCVCRNTCNVTSGIGGAGLGSDGKLYFYSNVGAPILEGNVSPRAEIALEYVKGIFQELFSVIDLQPRVIVPTSDRNRIISKLGEVGLKYKEYPEIHHIGSENCPKVANELVEILEKKGVEIRTRTAVSEIELGQDLLQLQTERTDSGTRGTTLAKFVILAVGKGGLDWLMSQSRRLEVRTLPPEPFLGVRIETARRVLNELSSLGGDPKLKLITSNGACTKTHCMANGGFVVMCKYDRFNLVDGLSYLNKHSENGSFNVITSAHKLVTPEQCVTLLQNVTRGGRSPPIAQLLGDLRRCEVSDATCLRANPIKPTLEYFRPGNIAEVFPREIISEVLSFLDKLGTAVPEIAKAETIIYAPVAEGIMPTICTDQFQQTTTPNVFAAGDGAGFSQGIVAAAITGVLAADGIRSIKRRQRETAESRAPIEHGSR